MLFRSLDSGQGYGIWVRASVSGDSLSGITMEFNQALGKRFYLRQWHNGKACTRSFDSAPLPSGMSISQAHWIVIAVDGDTLYATVDGEKLFDVRNLSAALASASCDAPAPLGTQVGFRTWDGATAVFRGTSLR